EEEIRQYTQQNFIPVYHELHGVLFKQLEQLWQHLHEAEFSKAEIVVLDEKIQSLAIYLKDSQAMSVPQAIKVNEIYNYYQQLNEHAQFRKSQNKTNELERFFEEQNCLDQIDTDNFEEWNGEYFQQAREQARLKRQQEKQAQATKLAEQSLKTVYLKIAAIIHPDRESNDVKKIKKTELLRSEEHTSELQSR